MLHVRDCTVRYGSVTAVRGVGMDAGPASMTALVGPNGSGKTSLLAAITGAVAATGTIELDGARIDGLEVHKRAAAGLAFVPDGRNLFGRLTVQQNLMVGAVSLRRSAAKTALREVLDRFPLLAERAGQRADTLSGGEGQQLMIARALVASPRVLLVDEPFQGLSQEATNDVLFILHGEALRGTAVLVASPSPVDGAHTIHMRHGSILEVAV